MKLPAIYLMSYLSLFTISAYGAVETSNLLATDQDKLSYSLGLEIGNNIQQGFKEQKITITPTAFSKGIEDAIAGNTPALSPKQVEEILTTFQAKQEQLQNQNAQKAVLANADQLFAAKNSPVAGNEKSTIVLVEFFDYQCVHCRRMVPVLNELMDNNKQLKVIFKEFPILSEISTYASKAALAAKKQGKYLALHEALLTYKDRLSEKVILEIAKKVGLSIDQLQKDMNSSEVEQEIQANFSLASKLGIQGTPAFIIANTVTLKAAAPKVFFVPGAAEFSTLADFVEQVQGEGFKYPANVNKTAKNI